MEPGPSESVLRAEIVGLDQGTCDGLQSEIVSRSQLIVASNTLIMGNKGEVLSLSFFAVNVAGKT